MFKRLQSDRRSYESKIVTEHESSHRSHQSDEIDVLVVDLLRSRRAHRNGDCVSRRHGGCLSRLIVGWRLGWTSKKPSRPRAIQAFIKILGSPYSPLGRYIWRGVLFLLQGKGVDYVACRVLGSSFGELMGPVSLVFRGSSRSVDVVRGCSLARLQTCRHHFLRGE
jgi:hypothetical protein